MIASTKLLQRELDNQNQVLKDYFQMDVLPDELSLDMSYNQIRLRYSMNSLYSGTVKYGEFIYAFRQDGDIILIRGKRMR